MMPILYSLVSLALTAAAIDRFYANDFAKGFAFAVLALALAVISIGITGLPPQVQTLKRYLSGVSRRIWQLGR